MIKTCKEPSFCCFSPTCHRKNTNITNGRSAWQDVFHVHFHVIPRFAGDGFKIKCQAPPTREALDQMAAEISRIDVGR